MFSDGRLRSTPDEIVELVAGERLVMRTSEGPFAMETSYTWETITDGSTRMTLRNRRQSNRLRQTRRPVQGQSHAQSEPR